MTRQKEAPRAVRLLFMALGWPWPSSGRFKSDSKPRCNGRKAANGACILFLAVMAGTLALSGCPTTERGRAREDAQVLALSNGVATAPGKGLSPVASNVLSSLFSSLEL